MPQSWQFGPNRFRSPGPYPFPLDDTDPQYKRIRVQLPDGAAGTVIGSNVGCSPTGALSGGATVLLDEGAGEDGRGSVWVEDVNTLVVL